MAKLVLQFLKRPSGQYKDRLTAFAPGSKKIYPHPWQEFWLKERFLNLIRSLEPSFLETGGFADFLLDLEKGTVRYTLEVYRGEEPKEILLLTLEEVADGLGWGGPVPKGLEAGEYTYIPPRGWNPEPLWDEERSFLNEVAGPLKNLKDLVEAFLFGGILFLVFQGAPEVLARREGVFPLEVFVHQELAEDLT